MFGTLIKGVEQPKRTFAPEERVVTASARGRPISIKRKPFLAERMAAAKEPPGKELAVPLDERFHAPNAQTVLFHLSLFVEFCEAGRSKELSASVSCECLRDAAEELCRWVGRSTFSSLEQAALVAALHQSEAAFRKALPELHSRTGAEKGIGALVELLNLPKSEQCVGREGRSVALGTAQRFGRTLGTFAASAGSNHERSKTQE